jgi:RNA-directed DNA polymerase
MRTIPKGSYERLSSLPSLWRAYLACRRGKRRQPRMAAFDLDADRFLCALHRALIAERYQTDPWRLRLIHEPKKRLIAAPSIRDRVVHRAVLDDIGPHYERGFIEHSYTGAKGRGPHRAVLRYQGWLRRYRYRLCLDIRRYFPSIHHRRFSRGKIGSHFPPQPPVFFEDIASFCEWIFLPPELDCHALIPV